MTTTHRSEERLDGKLSRAVLKAGRREQSLLPSHHIRYIDAPKVAKRVYVISILENFSRAILSSAIAPHQDLHAYLTVLRAAARQHGSPEAIVSDSGGVFLAKDAQRIYDLLGVRKEEIDKQQAWQNYVRRVGAVGIPVGDGGGGEPDLQDNG